MMSTQKKKPFSAREKRFILLFMVTLFISFFPVKALGQISPLIFLVGMIFFVQVRPVHHLNKYIVIVCLYSVIGFYYWLLLPQFWFPNYFLFFVTISSFLVLFYDFKPIVNSVLLRRLGSISLFIIWLESIYGIVQALYGFRKAGGRFDKGVGDIVWGTIAPPFDPTYAGSSPTFVILISTLFLFAVAVSDRRLSIRDITFFFTVVICWLLASLLHSIVFFGIAAVMAIILLTRVKISKRAILNEQVRRRDKRTSVGFIVVAIAFFVIIGPLIHPYNFSRILPVISNAFDISPTAKFSKLRAIHETIFDLPKEVWLQPLIGVGPGQYASRAAFMATGEYLRAPLPLLPTYKSVLMVQFIFPLFGSSGSSINFPSSSWLAVYGEMGLLGLLVVAVVIIKGIKVFRSCKIHVFPRMNLAMITLLIYLVLMGFQTVYWEYTQAIFPGALALKLCFDYKQKEESHRQKVSALPTQPAMTHSGL